MLSIRLDIRRTFDDPVAYSALVLTPASSKGMGPYFLYATGHMGGTPLYENHALMYSVEQKADTDQEIVHIHRVKQTLLDPTRTHFHEERIGGQSLMPLAAHMLAAFTGADLPGSGVNIVFEDTVAIVAIVPGHEELVAAYAVPTCTFAITDTGRFKRTGTLPERVGHIQDAIIDWCQFRAGDLAYEDE